MTICARGEAPAAVTLIFAPFSYLITSPLVSERELTGSVVAAEPA